MSDHAVWYRVAVNIIPPFTILKNYAPTRTKYQRVTRSQITGYELETFDILLKSENIKPKYYARVANQDMYYGTILSNGTTTGMFHDLQSGQFDAMIGYVKDIKFLKKYFDKIRETTSITCLNEYTFIKKYTNYQWRIIWNLISPVLPLILFVWIVEQVIVYWLLQRKLSTLANVFLDITKLLTGKALETSGGRRTRKRYPRLAALLWIVFQAFFTAIFQSVWTLHLSNPKTGYTLVPTSIDYLLENNLKLFYNPYDRKYFSNERFQVLNNSEHCFGFEECIEAVNSEPTSYTILSTALIHYKFADPQSPEFHKDWRCFSDGQIKSGNFFVFQKNNSLTKILGNKLLWLASQGINLSQVNKFIKPQIDCPKTIIGSALGMKNMRPTLYVLWAGHILAVCCFLIECVVYRIKRK
ncbi:hypothetical protein HUJ05_001227 [Dendroctonus ponderosae]|nr:hypothetical protein HUJ05_001227 [Dendroctonus ponderosae]